ncbi:unnamed protein product [Caenorhabditis bovis]|uniref:Uncharacterized protein n=1 Tax=Caenorhabditis bovis TaxID=2654633 RepID=A0A8S1EAB1_9PELO|nr:unnamed protein product [Caenorhabditis bovis]
MLLRKLSFIILLISLGSIYTQSIDEEESVHLGGKEGSGNGITDDEDMEGSSLPPDSFYATTPQVRPKFPSSTTIRIQTSQMIVTQTSSTTERIMTSSSHEPTTTTDSRPNVPFNSFSLFGVRGIFIILGTILLFLVILILFILCFKARNNKKQAYRPGQRESPDALLKE